MKTIIDLADEVIAQKNKSITDEIFLLIQNDKDFMRDYLRLVEDKGLNAVNKCIGKRIKERYTLINDDYRDDAPVSTLIRSHQCFK